MRNAIKAIVAASLMLAPIAAWADDPPPGTPPTDPNDPNAPKGTPNKTAPPTPSNQLPPAESTHHEQPPVPEPNIPGINGQVVEQAGGGSNVGYGRAGPLAL